MGAQLTSISRYPLRGYAGTLIGTGHAIDTVINGRTNVAAVRTIVITAVNSTVYSVTVNGVTASYTSDGSATAAEIRDGLAAAALASPFFSAVASLLASGSDLVLREIAPALGAMTVALSANLAATVNVAHQNEQNIPAGVIIQLDTAQVVGDGPLPGKMADAAGDQVLGVTLLEQEYVEFTQPGIAVYPPYRAMSVVKRGSLLVPVETNVLPTDIPCFRVTANGALTQLGALRAGTDSGNAVALTGVARFKEAALAGALVELAINLP
jgi:hypothetical protein